MSNLPAIMRRFAERYALLPPGSRGVVAVSGGVNSLVLLDVLRTLDEWPLHVATLDHSLRGADGASDAEYVRALAERWGLPCTVGRVDVPALAEALGIGLEDAARRARYTFLARVTLAVGAQWIAVAHNANDQAETVLMHVIRGSGLDGLHGMLPGTMLPGDAWLPDLAISCDPPLSGGPVGANTAETWSAETGATSSAPAVQVVRPLLEVRREVIEAYAAERGLVPCQDATNSDRAYLRNRVRHEVIPMLEQINPNMRESLVRLASIARDELPRLNALNWTQMERLAVDFQQQRAQDDVTLTQVKVLPDSRWASLRLERAAWRELDRGDQRAVIRAAVRQVFPVVRNLSLELVDHAVEVANKGRLGSIADLSMGLRLQVEADALRLYHNVMDSIALVYGPVLEPGQTFPPFSLDEPVALICGSWTFSCRRLEPGDNVAALHADPLASALSVPEGATLLLRARQFGDRWQPRGLGGHSQGLKKIWQSMKVPAQWRDRVPLLVVDGQIAWLVAPDDGQTRGRGRVAEPFALPEGFAEDGVGAGRAGIVVRWARIEQE